MVFFHLSGGPGTDFKNGPEQLRAERAIVRKNRAKPLNKILVAVVRMERNQKDSSLLLQSSIIGLKIAWIRIRHKNRDGSLLSPKRFSCAGRSRENLHHSHKSCLARPRPRRTKLGSLKWYTNRHEFPLCRFQMDSWYFEIHCPQVRSCPKFGAWSKADPREQKLENEPSEDATQNWRVWFKDSCALRSKEYRFRLCAKNSRPKPRRHSPRIQNRAAAAKVDRSFCVQSLPGHASPGQVEIQIFLGVATRHFE